MGKSLRYIQLHSKKGEIRPQVKEKWTYRRITEHLEIQDADREKVNEKI